MEECCSKLKVEKSILGLRQLQQTDSDFRAGAYISIEVHTQGCGGWQSELILTEDFGDHISACCLDFEPLSIYLNPNPFFIQLCQVRDQE